MDVIQAIFKRRAIKHFDKQFKITKEQQQRLLEATIQSPTSFNIQHWRFVILSDSDLRMRIRKAYGNDQAQITDASMLILFTADINAWKKDPQRYWSNTPKDVAGMLVDMLINFHQGREWLQRDEAQRSIGMAMQTLMLAAQEMGFDSCPMIGFDIAKVGHLINLPDGYVVGPMVAIGKKIKEPWPKPGQLPLDSLVFENSF